MFLFSTTSLADRTYVCVDLQRRCHLPPYKSLLHRIHLMMEPPPSPNVSNCFLHFEPPPSPNDFPRTLDDFPLTSAGFHLERPPSPAAPIVTMSNPCLINLCQSLYRTARRLMQTNHSNSYQPNRNRLGFCFRTNLISEMISESLTLCLEWFTAVPY